MAKYTYCVANSWAKVGEGRHVYVCFSERLTFTQMEDLKVTLQNIRSKLVGPDTTSWDIVYDALNEFFLKWGLQGSIADVCNGLIMY